MKLSMKAKSLLAGAAVAAAVVGAAADASASTAWPSHASYTWTNHNDGWANVRACPNTGCSFRFALYDAPVYMLCYTDAQWAYGNYWTNRWFYVYAPGPGRYGYISASLVYDQARSPRC